MTVCLLIAFVSLPVCPATALAEELTEKETTALKADAKKKAEGLLRLMELGDRMNHIPGEMSGGQQQRVAIARSLANDPEVVLADEPTGNLDSKTGGNVMTFLKKLHKEKGTTIIS